jgi:hypothetical protein
VAGLILSAGTPGPGSGGFETSVQPVLNQTCRPCHNDRLASGGLNLIPYTSPASIAEHREDWEKIVQKIRTGEMPPKGIPRPPAAQVEALMKFVQGEFEKPTAT